MLQIWQRGVTVVEVLIGVTILSLVLVVTSQLVTLYLQTVTDTQTKTVAVYQAEVAHELVRAFRDEDWSQLASLTYDTVYYPYIDSGAVVLSTTPSSSVGSMVASVQLKRLYRHNSTQVLQEQNTNATLDSDSRLVVVTITESGTDLVEQQAILTNLFEN